MAYMQLRDILAKIKRVHREVSDCCAESAESSDERIGLLADYFQGWQESMGRSIASFEESEREAILDTWVQFVPKQDVDKGVESMRRARGEDADTVVSEALNVQQKTAALVSQLAESMKVPAVSQMLAELSEFEQTVGAKLGRAEIEKRDA